MKDFELYNELINIPGLEAIGRTHFLIAVSNTNLILLIKDDKEGDRILITKRLPDLSLEFLPVAQGFEMLPLPVRKKMAYYLNLFESKLSG